MPTSFTVFSLGQLDVWDPTEGNAAVSTAAVNSALAVYGSTADPLWTTRQDFAPAGNGFNGGGGDPVGYDIDNNVSNDQFSINGGAIQTFDASMTFNAVITYLDGTAVNITAVVFQDTLGNTYWAPETTDNDDQAAINAQAIRSLELVSPIYADGTSNGGYGLTADRAESAPLCFTAGARILCLDGERLVEDVAVGDLVMTHDRGPQRVRWIASREIPQQQLKSDPRLRPVKIMAGALGDGFPTRDVAVSRQHRVLVRSKIAARMFGEMEVLVPAIKMTGLPGIFVDEEATTVTYVHLLFDEHQIVYAEGTPMESLFTGPEALKAVCADAREEILTLFPEVANFDYLPVPVRLIPSGADQKSLIARHAKNNHPIVCHS